MTGARGRLARVTTAGLVLLAALTTTGAARRPLATHLTAAATPSTAKVGSVVTLSGLATPRTAAPVLLQRWDGRRWTALAHVSTARTGAYEFHLRAPRRPATWVVRVTRPASAATRLATTRSLSLRFVKSSYVVSIAATESQVSAGAALTINGKVSPKATGQVGLEVDLGGRWSTIATTRLSRTSTYAFPVTAVTGVRHYRVAKPFSTTYAGGISKLVTVSGASPPVSPPPPASPAIATLTLPAGLPGHAYTETLAAVSGTAPYTWAATGLPAGFTLSASGVLSGLPLTALTASLAVTVTDSAGRTGAGALTLTIDNTTVMAWGADAAGQLGVGDTVARVVPTPTQSLTDVTAIASGDLFGLALRTDGTVWAWGDNTKGQLGGPAGAGSNAPVQVTGLSGVTAIAAGVADGYALKSDGTVWGWGANDGGQLGDQTTSPRPGPVAAFALSGAVAIAAGDNTGYAVLGNGLAYAWGANDHGQIGEPAVTFSPVLLPRLVNGLGTTTGIASLVATANTAIALLRDGTVRTWGYGANGELGSNSTADTRAAMTPVGLSGVVAIAGHSFGTPYALKADGTVWAWGYNLDGEVGNAASGAGQPVPVQVFGLTGAKAIGGGRLDGYAVLSDGTVRSWGDGTSGALGNNAAARSDVPVTVSGLTNALAVSGGGSWGMALVAG